MKLPAGLIPMLTLVLIGCAGDDGGSDEGPAMTSASATETGAGVAGSGSETSVTETGVADTSGDTALSCSEAANQDSCAAASDDDEGCGWFDVPTFALGGNGACGPVDHPSGYCFLTGRTDDGCGVLADASCPDGTTVVYYNDVGLEVGAVELFIDNAAYLTCDGPGGAFMPCIYDGTTYDPPECECGCP